MKAIAINTLSISAAALGGEKSVSLAGEGQPQNQDESVKDLSPLPNEEAAVIGGFRMLNNKNPELTR